MQNLYFTKSWNLVQFLRFRSKLFSLGQLSSSLGPKQNTIFTVVSTTTCMLSLSVPSNKCTWGQKLLLPSYQGGPLRPFHRSHKIRYPIGDRVNKSTVFLSEHYFVTRISNKLGLSQSVQLGKTWGIKVKGRVRGEIYSLALVVKSLALEEPSVPWIFQKVFDGWRWWWWIPQ